jgi:hypothetical protein
MLFGWLLASRERGHLVSTLSHRRVALWGFAAAAVAIPLLAAAVFAVNGLALPVGVLAAGTLIAGTGGSLFGVGLLWSARRASDRVLERAAEERLLR